MNEKEKSIKELLDCISEKKQYIDELLAKHEIPAIQDFNNHREEDDKRIKS